MDRLRQELGGLLRYIQRVRQEIAAIHRPADEDYQFASMGEQLDAIVKATERATNTIMEATENTQDAVAELRQMLTGADQIALLDRIVDDGNNVFEACSFQDITGQRVHKVVKSVTYVEERVTALVDIWGEDELAAIEVPADREKSADEQLVSGPQMEGEGLSQDDIDKLFD